MNFLTAKTQRSARDAKRQKGGEELLRDSFIFYRSWYEAIQSFPAEVQGEIYTAIFEYSLNGNETHDMGKIASAMWTLIRPQVDANRARYENGCKGGEFGKLGGAPKGNKNANKGKTTPKQPLNKGKTTPNDHENDHENDYGNENVACAREPTPKVFDSNSEFPDADAPGVVEDADDGAVDAAAVDADEDGDGKLNPFEELKFWWNRKRKTSKVNMSEMTQLIASSVIATRLMQRIEEFGEEAIQIAIDRIDDATWWQMEGKTLGVETFLKDDIFPKFLNREYGMSEPKKR